MSCLCPTFAYMDYIIKELKFSAEGVSLLISEDVKAWLEATSIVEHRNGVKVYIVNHLEFQEEIFHLEKEINVK